MSAGGQSAIHEILPLVNKMRERLEEKRRPAAVAYERLVGPETLADALDAEVGRLESFIRASRVRRVSTGLAGCKLFAFSAAQIKDYDATAGKVRTVAAGLSHNQPGDPSKLADVLIGFVDAPNPPVRLPLGSDTVAAIEAKQASDAAILD